MSGAANFLSREMLAERRRKRNEFVQRSALANTQSAAGGIADYGAMLAEAKARREQQRARRDELTGERDASRADAALEHDRALELIRARGEARPSSARGAARSRSSSTFADKAALKQSADERQRAIDDAGKRVSMALTVGGLPTARRRADETAKAIAAKYGMDIEDARRQVSLASTAATDAQEKRFRGREDQERASAMADTKLDRETAALGMDESKLDGQLNRDGPQFQQATAAATNAETSKRRQDLAEQKYKNRPRGSGKPKLQKVNETGAKSLGSARTTVKRIDSLISFMDDEDIDTGPLAGPAQNLLKRFGWAPTKFNRFKARAALVLMSLGRKEEGGKLADADYIRYEDALMNATMQEEDLKGILRDMRASTIEAYDIERQSYNVPTDDPRFPSIDAASSPPAPDGMVKMLAPDGRTTGSIPEASVAAAEARGFTRVAQ